MKARSWFSWHVCFLSVPFVCVRMWVCVRVCVYLWVSHCGQTPAHRLLVWLMNQCLQDVFEEVYCMPLFYSLKHPVLRLPVHTKEKINPLLTLPQWMALATVPSTNSSSSEQKEKKIMDVGSEKREIKRGVYTVSDTAISSISPSFLRKNKLNKNQNKKKKLPPKKLFLIFSLFSLSSLHLISLLFVMSHLLSFICCMVCQGRLEAGGLCLDSHRTVSILWRLRSRLSSHLLRVQRQLKRGSVTNLTPESLQGIPFKKK